jgi:small nuclear ribonucleoprotein (snRNP)-like protein
VQTDLNYVVFFLLLITDRRTYNPIIKGIDKYCNAIISTKEITKNKYFTKLFFTEYSLNFKENNGNSAFIK